ncbi:hypothetical protein ACIP9H_33425 [Streptomyces sp. NPDC088732]|uniref:hypothetical protein n=1 Tax=Streptomyces sp. NPDC088732 TaxID=3365879 RepID=UPI0038212013
MTAPAEAEVHAPVTWYWEAGGEHCPHGPQPDRDSPEIDEWWDRHQGSPQDVYICLDAPMGEVCDVCSEEDGDAVSMKFCRARPQCRAKAGTAPASDAHKPITVWRGPADCIERECPDYWDEEGEERSDVEACSHISEQQICPACSTADPNGIYYEALTVNWPCDLAPPPAAETGSEAADRTGSA